MEDHLAIIKRVIEEHQIIRGHIKLVGDSISDREALTTLEKARADWMPGRPELLVETQKKLQQSISFLDEGLRSHFVYEEKVLPPLLGELFMRAILLDHQQIKKGIDEAKSIVGNIKLEGLSREELLSRESHIQEMINSICQQVEEHATREEIILEMLQRALEEKKRPKTKP